jgi:hypothetical protein
MNVDFNLSEKDYDAIAEKVMQKASNEAFIKTLQKTSEEVAKEKYWHVLQKFHSTVEIQELLDKNMNRHILSALEDKSLIHSELRIILNSADMKRVTVSQLRQKAARLEQEADELEQEN